MKKYLLETEAAAMIMVIIGIVCSWVWGYNFGAWPAGIGMLLWTAVFLYRAFHWQEYERQNKQNIVIVIATIIMLLMYFFTR